MRTKIHANEDPAEVRSSEANEEAGEDEVRLRWLESGAANTDENPESATAIHAER